MNFKVTIGIAITSQIMNRIYSNIAMVNRRIIATVILKREIVSRGKKSKIFDESN